MRTRGPAPLIAFVLCMTMLSACSGLGMPAGNAPVGMTGVEIDPADTDPAHEATGGASPDARSTARTIPSPAAGAVGLIGGWRPITPPPLTLREGAAATWSGEELIILGGHAQAPCAATGACVEPTGEALADGAAYDPFNDTWRRIADHPDPAREPRAMGTGEGLVVGRPDEALWRYDAGTDTWERLGRTRDGLDLLAVTGDRMVAYASTHEVLGPPDHIHDPSTERWRALPPDPLGLTRDRRMVWVGEGLVLLGVPIDPQQGDPPLVRAAWLENPLEEDPGWHLLPDSVTSPGGEWVALGHDLVNLGLDPPGLPAAPPHAEGEEQPADQPTEDTQREDPRGPSRGGVLQLDPTGWFDLPAPPDDGGSAAAVHVPPAGGGRTAVAGGRALDLATGTWAAIPEDPALPAHPRVTAWAGDRVLVWGGPEGEALVWLPPWADEPVQGAAAGLQPQRPLADPGPARPPGPHGRPDARIDCQDEARIRLTDLSAGEDFGRDTPEQALRGHLHPQALHDGGRVVMVADIHASVVVGYRETVNATALRQPDGHWVVGLLTACGDVDLIIR